MHDSYLTFYFSCWKILLYIKNFTLWRPAAFRNSEKKHWNAHGFAQEFLWSCKGYRPGWSVKRRSKSSSLH